MEINRISPQKHKYLQIINTIAKSPERLYLIKTLPSERRSTVAIVGKRQPTTYGKEITHQLSYELAKRGAIIVSIVQSSLHNA